MQNKIKVIVVAGPTASGKTALAVEIARAFDGEIISADSMQIYKGMDIATAKPSEEEKKGIRHHLLDFLDPSEKYSVADFVCDAAKAIADIHARGKLPILAGGTGLYIDSLMNNIRFTEEKTDPALRAQLEKQLETEGAAEMLRKLSQFDPETANRLFEQDKKRIVRAFEVYLLSGKTLSESIAESKTEPPVYDPIYIGINYQNRDALYERINRRVDIMAANGLVKEAELYYQMSGETAKQAIGYKELARYLNAEESLEDALEALKKSTRNYAKRQITWFKRNADIHWIYPDALSSEQAVLDEAFAVIRSRLYAGCDKEKTK